MPLKNVLRWNINERTSLTQEWHQQDKATKISYYIYQLCKLSLLVGAVLAIFSAVFPKPSYVPGDMNDEQEAWLLGIRTCLNSTHGGDVSKVCGPLVKSQPTGESRSKDYRKIIHLEATNNSLQERVTRLEEENQVLKQRLEPPETPLNWYQQLMMKWSTSNAPDKKPSAAPAP